MRVVFGSEGRRHGVRLFIVATCITFCGLLAANGIASQPAAIVKGDTFFYDPNVFYIGPGDSLYHLNDRTPALANCFTNIFTPAQGITDGWSGSKISSPGLITVLIPADQLSRTVMLAVWGHGIISPTVDGRTADWVEYQAGTGDMEPPFFVWNLGSVKTGSEQTGSWQYAFKFRGVEYYERSFHLGDLYQDCRVGALVDIDNDNHYSKSDISSLPHYGTGFFLPARPSKNYTGPYPENEIGLLTVSKPYLLVDGDTIAPLADDTTDVLLNMPCGEQSWRLLKEYTPWRDVNWFGYYTDIDSGKAKTIVFRGRDSEGKVKTTYLSAGTTVGLWLLNDVNGDSVFNGQDSYLFSQRRLSVGATAKEHQWFMVYDVSAYKGTGALYEFFCPTESFSTTGDYDYLIFIDDNHTSANFDHNDMIVGMFCNRPPVAHCPNDTSLLLCAPGQVCLRPFYATDPDNNLDTVYVIGGTLRGDTVCFNAPSAGNYTITLIARDKMGKADTCQTVVTVTINRPPVASSPNDTTLFLCQTGIWICMPGYTAYDPDNNLDTVYIEGCFLDHDSACFSADEGVHQIKLIAIDECGAADTSITTYTIIGNHRPDAYSPADRQMFVCELGQICLVGFGATDVDGNLMSVVVQGGVLRGDTVCFMPVVGENVLRVIAVDSCGLADTSVTRVVVSVNHKPDATCPNDTTVTFTCQPGQICIGPFAATDVDGNLDTTFVIANGGNFNGTTYCFVPSAAGTYIIRYVARDECGSADTCQVAVTVRFVNRPPDAVCRNDTTIFVCALNQICISGFSASDPDGNLASVSAIGGQLQGNTICFMPIAGVNTIGLVATDSCGLTDTCFTRVTVNVNRPPVASCPHDTVVFIDSLGQVVCLPGFVATDPDHNIVSKQVVGATLRGDTACFAPNLGLNTLKFIAVDACGLADTCQTRVNVILAHVGICPIIVRPIEETTRVCVYGPFCDTIDVIDPDSNMIHVTASAGTLTPLINVPGHWRGLFCFTPPDSACGSNYSYQILITAYDDSCGGADTAVYVIDVLGKIRIDIPDSIWVLPGYPDTFPILIDVPPGCFCMGSFELTVTYDASIFTIQNVYRGALIQHAEYFYVNYQPQLPGCPDPPSGAFDVTVINDLNNQIPAPPICDFADKTVFQGDTLEGDVLLWVVVTATPNYNYPTTFCVPICFYMCTPGNSNWNAVSDRSGIYLWHIEGCVDSLSHPRRPNLTTNLLELDCGNLKVIHCGSVDLGDINLNNQPFEVGDVVTLANYLINPVAYPLNAVQMAASDVNRDGYEATIADLIILIAVVNGTMVPKASPPLVTEGELILRQDQQQQVAIDLRSPVPVGGFVIVLPVSSSSVRDIRVNDELGLDIRVTRYDDAIRVCGFSMTGVSIPAGVSNILSITMNSDAALGTPEVSLSDALGNLMQVKLTASGPLPAEFALTGAYPNPFNSSVTLKFGLPVSEAVGINIYDVAGRLVKHLDVGLLPAGYHQAVWDGTNSAGHQVPSGVYFARMLAGENRVKGVMKLVLLK